MLFHPETKGITVFPLVPLPVSFQSLLHYGRIDVIQEWLQCSRTTYLIGHCWDSVMALVKQKWKDCMQISLWLIWLCTWGCFHPEACAANLNSPPMTFENAGCEQHVDSHLTTDCSFRLSSAPTTDSKTGRKHAAKTMSARVSLSPTRNVFPDKYFSMVLSTMDISALAWFLVSSVYWESWEKGGTHCLEATSKALDASIHWSTRLAPKFPKLKYNSSMQHSWQMYFTIADVLLRVNPPAVVRRGSWMLWSGGQTLNLLLDMSASSNATVCEKCPRGAENCAILDLECELDMGAPYVCKSTFCRPHGRFSSTCVWIPCSFDAWLKLHFDNLLKWACSTLW